MHCIQEISFRKMMVQHQHLFYETVCLLMHVRELDLK